MMFSCPDLSFMDCPPHHILMPVLSLCRKNKIFPKGLIKYSDSDQDRAAVLLNYDSENVFLKIKKKTTTVF